MLFIPEIEKNIFKRHRRTVSNRISPPMGNPQSGFFSAAGNWWHGGIACLKLTSFFHFEEQTAVRIGEPIKYWWEIEQEQVLEKNPRKMLHRRAMIEKKDKMEERERKKGKRMDQERETVDQEVVAWSRNWRGTMYDLPLKNCRGKETKICFLINNYSVRILIEINSDKL